MPAHIERWPPVYDADSLRETIQEIATAPFAQSSFYDTVHEDVCQGDIVALRSGVPLLDHRGRPSIHQDVSYWLVIGNSCDFHRVDVQWTQLVPLIELEEDKVTAQERMALRRYRYSRRFFVPPWRLAPSTLGFIADLLRPVAIDKSSFPEHARVVARLSRAGWVLLHACLIRFLCRDDGRFDP